MPLKSFLPFILAGLATGAGLFFTGPALERVTHGGKAKAVITAERYYAAGPVLLRGDQSVGQTFVWEVNAPHVAVDQDGCCVVAQACQPGVYTAKLTVKSGGRRYTESTAVHSFQVGGVPPGPTPPPPGPVPPQPTPPGPTPPGPNPGPSPGPVPDSKFGLTKLAYTLASAVNSPTRAAEAKTLASGLGNIATRIDAGTYKGWMDAAQDSLAVFDSLGGNRPVWDKAIQDMRKAITKAIGLPPSLADMSIALKEVAKGLEFVQ